MRTAWTDFLVASAGATGALAGLVFVALSINLQRILAMPSVASRAGETIAVLAGSLLSTLVALIPAQTPARTGSLLLAVSIPVWLGPLFRQFGALRKHDYVALRYHLWHMLLHQLATVPFVLAGLSLVGVVEGGLFWLAIGAILALAVALLNAWVLLVEILR